MYSERWWRWANAQFVFFFQAEDGIRDYKVTGVQTCALPIVRDTSGFGLRRAFSIEILNSLRRQTYQAFLIRMSRAALRACPQAQASLFWIDFRKIHRRPIAGTSDSRNHVHLVRVSVLGQDEVSTMEKQKATIVRIHCRLIATISAATKG